MIKSLRGLFRCDHVWRYFGSVLCATFIPAWPFRCEKCKKISWTDQGKFPDKESYFFYHNEMGTDFLLYWKYFVDASVVGDHFVGDTLINPTIINEEKEE